MTKVTHDGHIWALEFSRYVCFSFRGNRAIFGWYIANSIFDLEKSRSRSQRKSTKVWSGNLQVRVNNCAKNERNRKSCSKVIAWTRISGRRRRRTRRRTNRHKNIKSRPVYRSDLITLFPVVSCSMSEVHTLQYTFAKIWCMSLSIMMTWGNDGGSVDNMVGRLYARRMGATMRSRVQARDKPNFLNDVSCVVGTKSSTKFLCLKVQQSDKYQSIQISITRSWPKG